MATATAHDPFAVTATSGGGGGSYDLIPAGAYPANCVGLIDLGTHAEEMKDRKTGLVKTKSLRKLALVFELSGEMKPDGTPYVIAERYTNGLGPGSKLREMIEGWFAKKFGDGEGFHLAELIGKSGALTIKHHKNGDRTYHNFGGMAPLMRGVVVPRPFRETVVFSLATPHDISGVDWLPYLYGRPILDIVRESAEYKALQAARGEDGDASEWPF